MKNILLPTDFSENAFNAIQYAVQLFKDEKCIFYLLHTYTIVLYNKDYSSFAAPIQDPDQIHQRKSLPDLRKTQTRIKRNFPNDHHIFKVISSSRILDEEIELQVKENNIDLVVMGTQGATGAKQVLLGTQTVQVINKAICPVLAVPSSCEFSQPEKILFTTDLEADYRRMNLKILKLISTLFSSRVYILHVLKTEKLTQEQERQKEILDKTLEGISHEFHLLKKDDLSKAINEFQDEFSIDILAMINNKHSFIENMLKSSLIKKIGFITKIPFLVIPPKEN